MSHQLGCRWNRASSREGLGTATRPCLSRPRARNVAVLAYRPERQQSSVQQQRQQHQGSSPEQATTLSTWDTHLDRAQTDELRRYVRQLQADNAELQTEIHHLAASLRSALTAPLSLEAPHEQDEDSDGPHAPTEDRRQQAAAAAQQLLQQQRHAEGCADPPAALHVHCHADSDISASWQASVEDSMLTSVDSLNGTSAVPPYHQPAGVSHATLSCSVQHPGSICCSKLSSALDPGGAACTISLHTTARCTADDATVHRHLHPEELRALAAHALVGAAHAFSQAAASEYRDQTAPPADVAAAHAGLVKVLENGVVISAERSEPSQFDHKSYKLTLQDPDTARRVRAIYKPRVYGDAGGWHRTPMEWVAYRLNLLLGLDLVPPTAYRSSPLTLCLGDEEEELVCPEGAMMLWVEDCRQLNESPMKRWGVDPAILLSDTRIMDVLLHNSDRHHGHFLLGPHWARGRRSHGQFVGDTTPVLIDHAASFRKEAVVSMEHENAFGTGPVRCVSASTYLRLRFLDSHTVAEELGAHLSRSEQRQLLHRRDYVLHYFDELVASQGYAATVRE